MKSYLIASILIAQLAIYVLAGVSADYSTEKIVCKDATNSTLQLRTKAIELSKNTTTDNVATFMEYITNITSYLIYFSQEIGPEVACNITNNITNLLLEGVKEENVKNSLAQVLDLLETELEPELKKLHTYKANQSQDDLDHMLTVVAGYSGIDHSHDHNDSADHHHHHHHQGSDTGHHHHHHHHHHHEEEDSHHVHSIEDLKDVLMQVGGEILITEGKALNFSLYTLDSSIKNSLLYIFYREASELTKVCHAVSTCICDSYEHKHLEQENINKHEESESESVSESETESGAEPVS